MRPLHEGRTDRIVRTAAWFYGAPRAMTGILLLAVVGLAVLMVVGAVAVEAVHRFGG